MFVITLVRPPKHHIKFYIACIFFAWMSPHLWPILNTAWWRLDDKPLTFMGSVRWASVVARLAQNISPFASYAQLTTRGGSVWGFQSLKWVFNCWIFHCCFSRCIAVVLMVARVSLQGYIFSYLCQLRIQRSCKCAYRKRKNSKPSHLERTEKPFYHL